MRKKIFEIPNILVVEWEPSGLESLFTSVYGTLTYWEDSLNSYNLWGVTGSLGDEDLASYPLEPIYGVVTALGDEVGAYDVPEWGVLVNFCDNEGSPDDLVVYYQKQPHTLVDVDSELEIDSAYDKALKFYTTGMALRDDNDVQNRAIGNEELALFNVELAAAIKQGAMDGTASNTQYHPSYSTGFDVL